MRRLEAVGLLRKLPPSGGRKTTTYEIIFGAAEIGMRAHRTGDAGGTTLISPMATVLVMREGALLVMGTGAAS